MDQIIVDDMLYVVGSDFLVVLLDSDIPAFGTFTEMWEAYKRGIPIYVVATNQPKSDLASMPLVLTREVFRSFEELIQYLETQAPNLKEKVEDEITGGPIKKHLWNSQIRRISAEEDSKGIKGRTFYVMGPIEDEAKAGLSRKSNRRILQEHGGKIKDPATKYDPNGPIENKELQRYKRTNQWEKLFTLGRKVYKDNLSLIQESNAVVVPIDLKTRVAGTAIELWEAYTQRKPIYIISQDPLSELNSWMLGMATEVFESEDALVEYLEGRRSGGRIFLAMATGGEGVRAPPETKKIISEEPS